MRFGLIGCGWAGAMRADAIRESPALALAVVSDQVAGQGQALAQKTGAAFEPDWQTLVKRQDVDAVIVATPPPLHEEMVLAALRAGKHVLCEKPLGRSPTECARMVEEARRQKHLLTTGFNLRFFPPIMKAREVLDSGRIGELDHIRSYAGHPGGQEFTHAWVHQAEVMGGGTLLDNGIHIIDLTAYFLGDVVEVCGWTTNHVWGFAGCEDNGFALLRNSAQRVAILQSSWTEWRGYQFRIEVYGTRGCVVASYPPMMTVESSRPGADGPMKTKRYLFPKLQVLERIRSYRWSILGSFQRELEAFVSAAEGKQTPLAMGQDGLRSVQVAHAVYRSGSEGRAIRLEPLPG